MFRKKVITKIVREIKALYNQIIDSENLHLNVQFKPRTATNVIYLNTNSNFASESISSFGFSIQLRICHLPWHDIRSLLSSCGPPLQAKILVSFLSFKNSASFRFNKLCCFLTTKLFCC